MATLNITPKMHAVLLDIASRLNPNEPDFSDIDAGDLDRGDLTDEGLASIIGHLERAGLIFTEVWNGNTKFPAIYLTAAGWTAAIDSI